jgi:hypothetical protein
MNVCYFHVYCNMWYMYFVNTVKYYTDSVVSLCLGKITVF